MQIIAAPSVPAIGSMAPDFTLSSTSGASVTLSSFRGQQHVLLAFFPFAFTRVCTAEVCAFGDDYGQFAEQGVAVLPISTDAVPSLKAFKEQSHTSVDLLSDFKRQASAAFGVLDTDGFFAKRAYVLIDKAGTVRWTHVEQSLGDRRDNAELLAEIARLQ
ncbi:MAG: redoxin domain-containing protein [Gemmatimonadaceae bacterium]|jgi:peroxiredoxin (alkyl hydroperoxide reductase subunit C)|nr:redoxin domain-containing protein [Gemmatimonadaceae bacterium]